jgi:hypothetical protein
LNSELHTLELYLQSEVEFLKSTVVCKTVVGRSGFRRKYEFKIAIHMFYKYNGR